MSNIKSVPELCNFKNFVYRIYTLLAILTSYIYIYSILYIFSYIYRISILNRIYIYIYSYIYRILRIFSHYALCKLTSVLNYCTVHL